MKKLLFTILGISLSDAHALTYVVRAGDTLSSVLHENKIIPIYGKNGSLVKTLILNPELQQKGDRIFPGQTIFLIEKNPIHEGNLSIHESEKNNVENGLANIATKIVNHRNVASAFEQSFFWVVSPSFSWKNLSSKDSNVFQNSQISALSGMNYGLSLFYGMRFNESIDLYSSFFAELVTFSSENDVHLLKNRYFASAFAVGLTYERRWQFEAMMRDEFFLTAPASRTVDIKKVSLPELRTTYKKSFYQFQDADLSHAVSGKIMLPKASQGISSNFSYGAGVSIEARLRNQSFLVGYEYTALRASNNSTNSENIFWKYSWETP